MIVLEKYSKEDLITISDTNSSFVANTTIDNFLLETWKIKNAIAHMYKCGCFTCKIFSRKCNSIVYCTGLIFFPPCNPIMVF